MIYYDLLKKAVTKAARGLQKLIVYEPLERAAVIRVRDPSVPPNSEPAEFPYEFAENYSKLEDYVNR